MSMLLPMKKITLYFKIIMNNLDQLVQVKWVSLGKKVIDINFPEEEDF